MTGGIEIKKDFLEKELNNRKIEMNKQIKRNVNQVFDHACYNFQQIDAFKTAWKSYGGLLSKNTYRKGPKAFENPFGEEIVDVNKKIAKMKSILNEPTIPRNGI